MLLQCTAAQKRMNAIALLFLKVASLVGLRFTIQINAVSKLPYGPVHSSYPVSFLIVLFRNKVLQKNKWKVEFTTVSRERPTRRIDNTLPRVHGSCDRSADIISEKILYLYFANNNPMFTRSSTLLVVLLRIGLIPDTSKKRAKVV